MKRTATQISLSKGVTCILEFTEFKLKPLLVLRTRMNQGFTSPYQKGKATFILTAGCFYWSCPLMNRYPKLPVDSKQLNALNYSCPWWNMGDCTRQHWIHSDSTKHVVLSTSKRLHFFWIYIFIHAVSKVVANDLNSSPLRTDITQSHAVFFFKQKYQNQLTIAQTHKEFSSLVDNILAKFQQLDSGKFRAVSTPVFNAKSTELASLFAHMSYLCQRLNLPMPTHLHRPPFFRHWRAPF